jgi:hypothetical protein
MRLAMPAFRTQACAANAPRKGSAHATSTLSDATLALSSARPYPTASFSRHFVFLLVHSVHSPSATAATAATGTLNRERAFAVPIRPHENRTIQVTVIAGDLQQDRNVEVERIVAVTLPKGWKIGAGVLL